MDESDSKMMCLHIPALLPHSLSVDYSLPVQSAAVIGAGLLHLATSNRQITELLLSQICKKPCSDKITEREGYSLASGLALGMVNLGAGRHQEQDIALLFRELELDQRLVRFIDGGKIMPLPRSMLSQI
jgi:anaphase-promoting complex subunit 1